MILYSEDMLSKVYKIYRMHQAKHNLGFMILDDFRILFEEQQQSILDQITSESEML